MKYFVNLQCIKKLLYIKILKFSLIFFLISLIIVACKKEEIIIVPLWPVVPETPGDSSNNESNSLVGNWKAFEFLGEDGKAYKLNEYLPRFDTIQNCQIFSLREKYARGDFSFGADSVTSIDVLVSFSYRNYTINDTSNCDVRYDPWIQVGSENIVGSEKYYTLSNDLYVTYSYDSIYDSFGNFVSVQKVTDTSTYNITNGVLFLDNFVRLRK